jgi:ribonuclease HI
MKEIHLYCDGGCSPNPGPGGWGAILVCPDLKLRKELSGATPDTTTNNRMELTAVIEALRSLKQPCRVRITTDSQYVAHAFQQHWIESWQRKGWKTSGKTAVKNQDLWEALLQAMAPHRITWHWIRGHTGHTENERCDELARKAREALAGK